MRIGAWIGLAALAAAWTSVGCQLIAGLEDPVPGSDGGKEIDARAADGRATDSRAPDGAAKDASADARGRDARMADGEPEASPDGADGGHPTSGYCASLSPSPVFCEDFDEATLGPFGALDMQGAGALGLSDAQSLSPPASMLVSLDAFSIDGGPDSGSPSWTVTVNTIGTYVRIRMGFDLYVPAPITPAQSPIAIVGLPSVNPNVLIGPGGGQIVGTDGTDITFAAPPVETWTRVSIDMFVTPDGGSPSTDTMVIHYDTKRVCCMPGSVSTPASFVQPGPNFGLFNQYNEQAYASAAWAVYFDNVTFDGQADMTTPLQPPL